MMGRDFVHNCGKINRGFMLKVFGVNASSQRLISREKSYFLVGQILVT